MQAAWLRGLAPENVLTRIQLRHWVDRFGVPASQIQRDHLISQVLASLPDLPLDSTFFGGTALCRTHLPNWRLSEDIDLLVPQSGSAADTLATELPRALRREYPGLALRWQREGSTMVGALAVRELVIRIQLVALDASYRRYPTIRTGVMLRYEDLPAERELRCPTAPAAAAMKLTAWADRGSARDLCDLFGLTEVGALTEQALVIAAAAAAPVQRHQFSTERLPSQAGWIAALGHQMRQPPPRELALATVRRRIAVLAGWVG